FQFASEMSSGSEMEASLKVRRALAAEMSAAASMDADLAVKLKLAGEMSGGATMTARIRPRPLPLPPLMLLEVRNRGASTALGVVPILRASHEDAINETGSWSADVPADWPEAMSLLAYGREVAILREGDVNPYWG